MLHYVHKNNQALKLLCMCNLKLNDDLISLYGTVNIMFFLLPFVYTSSVVIN